MVLLVTVKVRLHIVIFSLTFIYLNLKRSYWVSYIDYPINQILPNKSYFLKHINNVFTETKVLDKEDSYHLEEFNVNLLLKEKEIFSNKIYRTNVQDFPSLTNYYLSFCFSFSSEQLTSIPTRVTSKPVNVIEHVLTKYSQKVS